jgi:protein-export membrane protein SecD
MKEILNKFYIVLAVVVFSLWLILFYWGFTNWKQWLDLAWWVRLLYHMDFSQYRKNYKNEQEFNTQRNKVINIVKRNIDWRISKLWVSDYSARNVSLAGQDYIEIELGWIQDIEKAKKIIWKTVQMTFKVPFNWEITPQIKAERQLLAEKILQYLVKDQDEKIADYVQDPKAWNIFAQQVTLSTWDVKKIFWESTLENLKPGYVYPKLLTGKVQAINTENFTSVESESFDIYKFLWKTSDGKYSFMKISVALRPAWQDAKYNGQLLNGERFKMATVDRAPSWEAAVNIYFDDKWREMFCKLTKEYLNKPMAIFIWNKLMTAPFIRAEICGGVSQITWNFTHEQAAKLAEDLNTGAMPVPLKLEQEEKVSPVLGEKAFKNSLIAAGLWVVLIFLLFLIFYWPVYAIVTLISLIIFFITLGGFIKWLWVVLSLSAIAAIILNIGMAVDANVIIFERIREELRNWSSWQNAILKWYHNSLSAIRDGNLTTGLIAFLLFLIGTNIFKWFGTMLIINIIIVLLVMVPSVPALLLLLKKK